MTNPSAHPAIRRIAHRGLQWWVTLTWMGSLAACAPSPSPSPSMAPTRPLPSPTPSLTVSLDAWHIDPTSSHVVGLVTSAAGPASSDVMLEVTLHDPQGATVGREDVRLSNTYLLPAGQGFFAADFPSAVSASAIQVRVLSNTAVAEEVVNLDASVVAAAWGAGPSMAILGRLTNPGDKPVRLQDLWVVGLDEAGQPRTVARGVAGAEALDAGESVPFRADAQQAVDVTRWAVLAQGSLNSATDTSSLETESIRLQVDPQGRPFATGWLVNRSDRPRTARLVLLATAGDAWLSAGLFEFPVPLPPHATWPFSVGEFPGLAERGPQGEDSPAVDLVPFVVEGATALRLVDLTSEVTGFEAIGSNLYLRGSVRNAGSVTVDRPSLSAQVQSSDGELVTAGWILCGDRLGPGEEVPFRLALPVPDGIELALAEYSVEAFGTRR